MIEMGVRQQDIIDACRIEVERLGILFIELPAALMQAAIDQDPLAGDSIR